MRCTQAAPLVGARCGPQQCVKGFAVIVAVRRGLGFDGKQAGFGPALYDWSAKRDVTVAPRAIPAGRLERDARPGIARPKPPSEEFERLPADRQLNAAAGHVLERVVSHEVLIDPVRALGDR